MVEPMGVREHWQRIYREKAPEQVSWYQEHPTCSLDLIRATGLSTHARILDVGGGASRLVDLLLEAGFAQVGVLDISSSALAEVRRRLGASAARVEWIEADVRTFDPSHTWDLWHDRAVFHFLVDPTDRADYQAALQRSVPEGGHVVIATFGPGGPPRCSGLDVVRYSPTDLAEEFEPTLRLIESRIERHRTPSGTEQEFVFGRFARTAVTD
jgi:SAM-dependent methyltransferase